MASSAASRRTAASPGGAGADPSRPAAADELQAGGGRSAKGASEQLAGCTVWYTGRSMQGSQGMVVAPDNSCAYLHYSTSPSRYYESKYGLPYGLNMDRGGFGHASNGTTFGCLFDGVTAGGEINAYAAQAFAEYSLKWLATNHDRLSIDDLAYGDQFREAFRQCTLFANSPDLARKAEGGSATAVMATVHRHRKNMYLLGASMGDAACMIVNDHSVELASTWQRAEFAGHDTGGQLSMCVGLQGVAATFKKPINKFNIIILATDGLTDNIHRAELEKILFFVVTSPAFNLPVTAELPGKGAALPKYSELSAMFGLTRAEPANMLSCEMVCRRIKHYIGWVTEALYEQEQHFYGLEVALKKASAEKDGAARLEIVRSALREAQNNAAMSAVPVPALPTAVSDDGKELLGVLEGYMASLYKERKRNHKAGKTDDAMVVVLKPLQKHAALR